MNIFLETESNASKVNSIIFQVKFSIAIIVYLPAYLKILHYIDQYSFVTDSVIALVIQLVDEE